MKLKCPKCGFIETDAKTFIDTTTECELCGEHSGIECPVCGFVCDHVYCGNVCTECGLIFGGWDGGRCKHHPNAKHVSWHFDLHRGG